MRSLLYCKFQCSSCNVPYYGKTKHIILRFVSRNIWESLHVKSTTNYTVHDHMLVCDNIVSFEDFSILTNCSNDFKINLQESLLIHCDGPQPIKYLSQPL